MLILAPAICSAQVAFQYMTTKTFVVVPKGAAVSDTTYIYAPPAFGHKLIHIGNQPLNTDTTGSGAKPAPYVFTTDTLDFQTTKVAGVDSTADSTLIKIKPLDVNGTIIRNDSLAITTADTTADIYSSDSVYGYKVGFKKTKAPYGVAIIHVVRGSGGTFKAQYRIVWPVHIYQ